MRFQSIKEYVEYYKPMGTLREILINIPRELLPVNDENCKKVLLQIIDIYFEDNRN